MKMQVPETLSQGPGPGAQPLPKSAIMHVTTKVSAKSAFPRRWKQMRSNNFGEFILWVLLRGSTCALDY